MNRCFRTLPLAALGLLLSCGVVLHAQTITGSITGTVSDSSGAVIPGAKITATAIDTNVRTATTSNNDGIYSIRFLEIGHYNVAIEAPGFATRAFGPIAVEANNVVTINASMLPAGTTQTVKIEGTAAPLLNTENAQVGTTLDSTAIANFPLVGEQFVQLMMFTPGSVNTNPASLSAAGNITVDTGSNNGTSVNGNRNTTNNYLLDGIGVNDTLNNTVGYNVSPEALGQIQVTSANANAEFGSVNGGDVIMLLKSGTNQFHGELYYFISDWHLDANTWANKNFSSSADFIPRSPYTQPYFGATLGGPILHNRLFFFADYEGIRYHSGGLGTATVLTEKMRTGDFSELLDSGIMKGRTVQLYDASTTAYAPYTDNQIPIISPVATYLFAHPNAYPLPNHAVSASAGTPDTGNYVAPTKNREYDNQFDVKINANLGQNDRLMGRWIQSSNGTTTVPVLAISFPSNPRTPVKGIALNEVHTFNASMVNEFRAGYTRINRVRSLPADSTGLFGKNGNSVVGIGAPNQGIPGFAVNSVNPIGTSGLSTPNGTEYSSMGTSFGGQSAVDNTFTYGDDFTWLKGKHTLKFGAQFSREQSNAFSAGNDGVLGFIAYTGLGTASPGGSSGYSMADFVLDRVAYAGHGVFSGPQGLRQWRDAYYTQDDWKVKPNLTVNLGFRYQFVQPMYEVNNKYTNVNLATKQIVLAGSPQASAMGGRALVHSFHGDYEPRIGFAWSVTPRFVVRSGYGAQTFMEATGEARRMTLNPPFNADNFAVGTVGSVSTPAQYFTVENGFSAPNGVAPVALNAWDVNIRPAFVNEYSLALEYQVSNTASLTAAYVGEMGKHLVSHISANQLFAPCVIDGVVQSNISSANCVEADPAPFYNIAGQTGSIVETLSNGNMNYNGLQVSFRQRLSHGLEYTVNYTYAKALTDAVGFFQVSNINGGNNYPENSYNPRAEYGPNGTDVRHSVNFHLVYDLPLGRNRMFGANMNRALDEVIGDWRVSLTGVGYTGFPVTLTAKNNAFTGNKWQHPNQYRPLRISHRSLLHWWGTDPSVTSCTSPGVDNGVCAYGQPADGTYGTGSIGSERAPGYQDFDASVSKSFSTYHEQRVTFRADATNFFNHTSLGNPNSSITSSAFGAISSVRSGPRKLQLELKYLF